MKIADLHEAQINFSHLIDAAAAGEPIIIAKEGKPIVQLLRVGAEQAPPRTGFLAGEGRIPQKFDALNSREIGQLFEE